jgi:hypothetical protein
VYNEEYLMPDEELVPPDGVCSVVSWRVEHGQDAYEAEGSVIDLHCDS